MVRMITLTVSCRSERKTERSRFDALIEFLALIGIIESSIMALFSFFR